ncbi:MAG: dephospho-CoA kinase [Alphaproteobacteria bacterium]|jgi:dephospho-CoA kinase|nr:dephospho-CoA kinase [Alphaproteobacteria bacterium]MDP7221680.1 dephospho-CoA kinase [Alphaproteobacteria bacterium]
MAHPVIIGLTGSIAMGKSTAADMLRNMGIPVHCSDDAAHDIMAKGGAGYHAILAAFSDVENLLDDAGEIDRKGALGPFIYTHPERKTQLEDIIHPLVRDAQQDFIRNAGQKGADIVVLDIPLLFETGAENRMDGVICVTAPAHIQRQRVFARDNTHMTEEKFQKILAAQMPDAEKRQLSDYVVSTALGLGDTRKQLETVIKDIRANINVIRNAPKLDHH